MERSLKSVTPPPPPPPLLPQDPQRTPPPLPQVDTQLSPTTGPPPGRTARLYTIEDILGRPQPQEQTVPQLPLTDPHTAGETVCVCVVEVIFFVSSVCLFVCGDEVSFCTTL
ncbi:hypothetical protein Pmani_039266 [Petrolisthes manimaculis]|uniref:Uncharacterized protein n=1 Tax=Petrolisthes manimaculis TaxID=1843537 RepID=A0AAE1NEH6_9EUCA|nr:hypothetical protein Pmani_039266 [Petrolisthes manimaculis]